MDALSLLYGVAGAVIGGVAVAVALDARRSREPAQATGKLTSVWRLSELREPLIVAGDIDIEIPAGSRVVTSGLVPPRRDDATSQVRQSANVSGTYAVDAGLGRAILFLGGVREGALAYVTSEPAIVARLAGEGEALWQNASPYIERHSIAELSGRAGSIVETHGTLRDVLPFQYGFLLRLEDAGHTIAVTAARDPGMKGRQVVVRGTLGTDRSGYAQIAADEVTLVA